jgi:hypothetical protein
MKIQAISSWQNGEEKLGTQFDLRITYDNLSSSAQLYYTISTEQDEEFVSQVLVGGNLTLDGEEYQLWDADPSANAWAYDWALAKLNLTKETI